METFDWNISHNDEPTTSSDSISYNLPTLQLPLEDWILL